MRGAQKKNTFHKSCSMPGTEETVCKSYSNYECKDAYCYVFHTYMYVVGNEIMIPHKARRQRSVIFRVVYSLSRKMVPEIKFELKQLINDGHTLNLLTCI